MGVKLRKNPLRQLNLLEQEKQVFSTKTWGGGGGVGFVEFIVNALILVVICFFPSNNTRMKPFNLEFYEFK